MKEWICKEEPLKRADGASVGVGFRKMVELVRCKDCKHYHKGFNCDLLQKPIMKGDEWFCADGERKADT